MYSCINSKKYLEAEIFSHSHEIPADRFVKQEELSEELQKLLQKRGEILRQKLDYPKLEIENVDSQTS